MTENPYAPPRAHVADASLDASLGKAPSAVRVAVRLYWISLALGFVNLCLTAWLLVQPQFSWSLLIGLAVGGGLTLLITVWLVVMVAGRRNWARIIILVLSLISIPYFASSLVPSFEASAPGGILLFLVYGLQYFAVILLFLRESNAWFRKPASPSQPVT